MLEFDDYSKLGNVKAAKHKTINITKEISIKLKCFDSYVNSTSDIINILSNQTDVDKALEIAISWYKSTIRLAKEFYEVKNTTDQVYNNLGILINDVKIANFVGIKRTFLTTFTNVLKYERVHHE
ncbi:hypothetical protein [Mycoplasma sp. P36-A1]|uniref:hypothetical protein n=1 Tax=Mycoplasma sp. P36-A1 TaxID=3252900 RepID=UPI003C2CBCEB